MLSAFAPNMCYVTHFKEALYCMLMSIKDLKTSTCPSQQQDGALDSGPLEGNKCSTLHLKRLFIGILSRSKEIQIQLSIS